MTEKKLKMGLEIRLYIISLLMEGLSREEVIVRLHDEQYPECDLVQIKKIAFPSGGPFSIKNTNAQEELQTIANRMVSYTEELSKKSKERLNVRWQDISYRQKMSEAGKKYQETEQAKDRRKKMQQISQTPEHRQASSDRMKRLHQDPKFARKHSLRKRELMRQMNSDPKFREEASNRLKNLWNDPEFREKHESAAKRLFSDPSFVLRFRSGLQKYWAEYRHKKASMAPPSQVFGFEGSIVPVDYTPIEDKIFQQELAECICSIVSEMTDLQRAMIALQFDMPHFLDEDAISCTTKEEQDIALLEAMKILQADPALAELATT
jgi:hypothetical protein